MIIRWQLLFLFPLVVQTYLIGCYYDYGQPLVLPEQLPIDICTHVLLIGTTIVKDVNVKIIQHPYNGFNALQSMRDYRARHFNGKLKFIPSIIGDDTEWKIALNIILYYFIHLKLSYTPPITAFLRTPKLKKV